MAAQNYCNDYTNNNNAAASFSNVGDREDVHERFNMLVFTQLYGANHSTQ